MVNIFVWSNSMGTVRLFKTWVGVWRNLMSSERVTTCSLTKYQYFINVTHSSSLVHTSFVTRYAYSI